MLVSCLIFRFRILMNSMDFHQKPVGRKKSRVRMYLIIILALGLVAFTSIEIGYQYLIHTIASEQTDTVPFVIKTNETPKQISTRLFDEGLIKSKWAFLRYADKQNLDIRFQAGRFYFPKNITIMDLAERMTSARPEEITVTVREGLTNAQIDELLAGMRLIEPGEFVECVRACDFSEFPFLPADAELREGFFFPDSYFVNPDSFEVQEFAKRQLTTFDEKTKAIFGTATRNGWEILKMASIVEKESNKPAERPIVAGILWKRFDAGQLLGADATTRFAAKKETEALTVADLQDKNPWNTRAVTGLPPGAICNPGLEAIEAAANPANTEYWYYLHDSKGEAHYATTNDEHNENKARYL